jgi:hypothetical protein
VVTGLIRDAIAAVPTTMQHSACVHLRELSAGMAVGALDPAEHAVAAQHLATCRDPHPQLGEDLALAALIGFSVPEPVMPPSSLRERLLASIRSEEG